MPNYRRRNTYQQRKPQFGFRINDEIRADVLRVLDEEGEMLGIFSVREAIAIAVQKEMDLIEINPKSEPPIAKVIELSKFKYQQQKKQDKQKVTKSELKNIQISVRTSIHDLEVKARKIKEFLEEGHRVRIDVNMRGREQNYPDIAFKQINLFLDVVTKYINYGVEAAPKLAGSRYTCTVLPKAN